MNVLALALHSSEELVRNQIMLADTKRGERPAGVRSSVQLMHTPVLTFGRMEWCILVDVGSALN